MTTAEKKKRTLERLNKVISELNEPDKKKKVQKLQKAS